MIISTAKINIQLGYSGFYSDIFTGVLGIIESGFSGMRVLKLTDLVFSTTEFSFSEPLVLKTSDLVLKSSESSFTASDCENTVLDRTTTTSLCTAVVPRARRLWSRSTQRYAADRGPHGRSVKGWKRNLISQGGNLCARKSQTT